MRTNPKSQEYVAIEPTPVEENVTSPLGIGLNSPQLTTEGKKLCVNSSYDSYHKVTTNNNSEVSVTQLKGINFIENYHIMLDIYCM